MAVSERRLNYVETRNGLYRTYVEVEADPLTAESNVAILCFDFAELAKTGADLFESINCLDEDWRILVFRKAVPYCEVFERRIERLYRMWLETSERLMSLFPTLENEYQSRRFPNDDVGRIQRYIAEVRGLLMSDRDFFTSDKLAEVRDSAIDSFRKNQAELVECR